MIRICLTLFVIIIAATSLRAEDSRYDLNAVPNVPDGFKVEIVAREPLLSHPTTICFDVKGRMFIGGGPQYRRPKKDSPKDDIRILIDENGDGIADRVKIFASGFNCIQGLAWRGNDLYVAHSPSLTIVRDLDGDDEADEFVDIFTGLSPLKHGLHGLQFGPDGKLYMTQGSSTVSKNAPKVFRDLMCVASESTEVQKPRTYKKGEWTAEWLEPYEDEVEGAILRCDPDGSNLEVFARGLRNPWDMAFDDAFNILVADNDDGPEHDRLLHAFHGANFGYRHTWSPSWTGENNPATAPVAGLFPNANGSAVGMVFYASEQFPAPYRNTFFVGDWQAQKVFCVKTHWEGAGMKTSMETFASVSGGNKALFRPTDMEVGPDGALYVVGWGSMYGSKTAPYLKDDAKAAMNEGRVFKIWNEKAPLVPKEKWFPAKREKAFQAWTLNELIDDLVSPSQTWRVNALDELVRRGTKQLNEHPIAEPRSETKNTWCQWLLYGKNATDAEVKARVVGALLMFDFEEFQGLRVQLLRIAATRRTHLPPKDISDELFGALKDNPRLRLELALLFARMEPKRDPTAVLNAIADETDPVAFYAEWKTLQETAAPATLEPLLKDKRPGVRRAALLALLETNSLPADGVLPLVKDGSSDIRKIALMWLAKQGKGLPSDALADLLNDPDAEVRKVILQCMARTRLLPKNRAQIADFHANAKGAERAEALKALAGVPGVMPLLWVELDNADAGVREAAVHAFAQQGKPLVEFIFSQLKTASLRQRNGALAALATQRGMQWVPNVPRLELLRAALDDPDPAVRRDASAILWRAMNLEAEVTAALAGDLARKMAADSDRDVKSIGVELAKRLKIELAPAKLEEETIDVSAVLALVPKADPARGREIFFRANTPGCVQCHALEGRGNALGPDLSGVGLRHGAKGLAESIMDPNKVIIEGYQPTTIITRDGRFFSGVIKEESADALTIVDSSGRRTPLGRNEIATRNVQAVSFMPDNFREILKPEEIAGLVAWLQTLKAEKK